MRAMSSGTFTCLGFGFGRRASWADQFVAGLPHQPFTRAVDEQQLVGRVERKDRDADLLHDVGQECRRLHRFGALALQRRPEVVDLPHDHGHRAAAARAQAPNRIVALPQGAQQVGDEVERTDRDLPRRRCRAHPDQQDDDEQGPPHFVGGGIREQKIDGDGDRREAAAQYERREHELEISSARRTTTVGQPISHGDERRMADGERQESTGKSRRTWDGQPRFDSDAGDAFDSQER